MRALVFIVLPLLTAVACGQPGEDLRADHVDAARLLDERKWEEAAQRFRRILERGNEHALAPHASLGLARARAGAGRHDDARAVLRGLVAQLGERRSGHSVRWRSGAGLESARVLVAQGKNEEALAEYGKSIAMLSGKSSQLSWKVMNRVEAAEFLAAHDRRKEAIALLTESLEELKAPVLAGLRAFQTAVLARIYMTEGERDWAVSLLERIRRDSEIGEADFRVAEAFVEGRAWKRPITGRLRLRRRPQSIRIEAEGRFELGIATQGGEGEMRVDAKAGLITSWFNLEEDPFRAINLVGPRGDSLIGCRGTGTEDDRKDEELQFEILEDNHARVRLRTRQTVWPNALTTYTLYPTGQLYLGHALDLVRRKPAFRVRELSVHGAVNSGVAWQFSSERTRRMAGEGFLSGNAPYLLAHDNPLPSARHSLSDDLLLVPAVAGRFPVFVAREQSDSWCRFSLVLPCDADATRQSHALHLRLYPRDLNSGTLAKPYVNDYQSPAEVRPSGGAVVRNDPGDLNGDGFNESEGCHVVERARRVTLRSGEIDRHQPAIKFLRVMIQGIPDLEVSGAPAPKETYNLARLGNDSFLLQWLGVVKSGGGIDFSLK